jgi:hypothetical protein
MRQFVRKDPMTSSVPRKKIDLTSAEVTSDNDIGGGSEGRLDMMFGRIRQGIDLVDSTTPDDTDGWLHVRAVEQQEAANGTPNCDAR